MKLDKFIEELQVLQAEGHGSKDVYYRSGSSGDCGLLSSAFITDEVDGACGPFDLDDGQEYVSIYAGN
jgi:hypothetical protein